MHIDKDFQPPEMHCYTTLWKWRYKMLCH